MTPIKRQFDFYLEDILQSMLRISEYIDGKKFKKTSRDSLEENVWAKKSDIS
jgi:uncharacterized protein with HEPN domain